jgi:hypothetical protein
MPYVSKSDRIDLNQKIVYAGRSINNAGELNYLLTRIVDQYIYTKGKSYASINEAIGALECAKLELYRRIAAPYEDTKIQQNGDVYTI